MPTASTNLDSSPTAVSDRLRTALRACWPTALGVAATGVVFPLVLLLPPTLFARVSGWSVLVAAVIYLIWGAARGDLAERGRLAAQTGAVLVLGAVALAAVTVDRSFGVRPLEGYGASTPPPSRSGRP